MNSPAEALLIEERLKNQGLEKQIAEANERIKRLEDAGDALAHNHNPFTFIDWMKAREN